jgi:hypothetical protein
VLWAFLFAARVRLNETPAGAGLQVIYLTEYPMGGWVERKRLLFYFLAWFIIF